MPLALAGERAGGRDAQDREELIEEVGATHRPPPVPWLSRRARIGILAMGLVFFFVLIVVSPSSSAGEKSNDDDDGDAPSYGADEDSQGVPAHDEHRIWPNSSKAIAEGLIAEHLGAAMVDDGHTADSKDSKIYMSKYVVYSSKGKHYDMGPAGVYNIPIVKTHTLNYNESVIPFEHWHMGRQWVAKMISKTMSVNQQFVRGPGAKLDPWGFKHPRTALLVPFWHGTLSDKFVFVHVLRDGKDVVEGDNQIVFNDHCNLYYGRRCDGGLRQRLEFWADLNRDVFNYVLTSSMQADQYIAVRVEDLVSGAEPCFRRLAAFVGLSKTEMNKLVPFAIEKNKGHKGSYFGHNWTPEVRAEVERKAGLDQDAMDALKFWGYSTDRFNLSVPCEEMAWMSIIRNKKGPLPGDDR